MRVILRDPNPSALRPHHPVGSINLKATLISQFSWIITTHASANLAFPIHCWATQREPRPGLGTSERTSLCLCLFLSVGFLLQEGGAATLWT